MFDAGPCTKHSKLFKPIHNLIKKQRRIIAPVQTLHTTENYQYFKFKYHWMINVEHVRHGQKCNINFNKDLYEL